MARRVTPFRVRSLRATVLVAVLFAERALQRAEMDAHVLAESLRTTPAAGRLDVISAVAAHGRQRVRLVDANGTVLVDVDRLTTDETAFPRLGDRFYGPTRRAVVTELSNKLLPAARDDVRAAQECGKSASCKHSTAGNLDYCAAAERVGETEQVILVEGISRRALQALYESRRQLFKLTLVVLGLGLVLWWWLTRHIVKPIEALRTELLVRAAAAAPQATIALERHDELGDLAASFNALLEALAARGRETETFLAELAHEFKNPVAAIRAAAEQLTTTGDTEESRQRLARVLTTSATRLDGMVTQFLELARAESGLPNERRESVDLPLLLRGLTESLKGDDRYTGLQVHLSCPDGPGTIHGVARRLESALRNLLDNAASFAGNPGSVKVVAEEQGGWWEVLIEDSGPGISKEDLGRLFERFFTTRGDRHGTGLGLALTRAVVEAHGGLIRAESKQGLGATFVVRIPAEGS